MPEIQLSKQRWHFDPSERLGPPGGFGEVFAGSSTGGEHVAIKRLRRDVRNHVAREIEISGLLLDHDYNHVIPILDVGLDQVSDDYFIVMARAERSLQDLADKSAPISEFEALTILDAIVSGLDEIGEFVHRDLKPGNILLHNGVWKIADLGLARFAQASTALRTMKGFLSPPYAAPEMWRNDHAGSAADVYSVGCMVYTLVAGGPPFAGPEMDDYSRQHQTDTPPQLNASSRLRQLALACLSKNPALRPSVGSLKSQIQQLRVSGPRKATGSLAYAAAVVEEKRAKEEARRALEQRIVSDRTAAATEAAVFVRSILRGVLDRICEEAPNAELKSDSWGLELSVRLGNGTLGFAVPFEFRDAAPPGFGDWDVLAGAMVELTSNWTSGSATKGRSANLWFAKTGPDQGYRWWEVAYRYRDSSAPTFGSLIEPFGLAKGHTWGGYHLGADALRHGWVKPATKPRPMDGEDLERFYERWAGWLATVAVSDVWDSWPVLDESGS